MFRRAITTFAYVAVMVSAFTVGVLLAAIYQNHQIFKEFDRQHEEWLQQAEAQTVTVEVVEVEPEPYDVIVQLATEYGVDKADALRIANCESRLDPEAKNPHSSATGLYQWIDGTWSAIGSPGDRLDPYDNARAFMEWYPKYPGWWVCK